MNHTVHFMAITTERQLLSAKAARGWATAQLTPEPSLFRQLLRGAAQAINRVRVIQPQAMHLPSTTGMRQQTSTSGLIDMLPNE